MPPKGDAEDFVPKKKEGECVKVVVRVRPLFEHEADRGEWECVSTGEWATRCTRALPKHDPKGL